MPITEQLALHYQRIGNVADVHRVILASGAAIERRAAAANPLQALGWLGEVYKICRQYGMKAEADRLLLLLKQRVRKSSAEYRKKPNSKTRTQGR